MFSSLLKCANTIHKECKYPVYFTHICVHDSHLYFRFLFCGFKKLLSKLSSERHAGQYNKKVWWRDPNAKIHCFYNSVGLPTLNTHSVFGTKYRGTLHFSSLLQIQGTEVPGRDSNIAKRNTGYVPV